MILLDNRYGLVYAEFMAQELTLITNRRRDVEQEIVRLRQTIALRETELTELEMAERVIVRLTGSIGAMAGGSDTEFKAAVPRAIARDKRPLPEMILTVMQDKLAEGISGMEPKNVAAIIRERWRPDIAGTYVSTTFWRMMKGGLLEKVGKSSTYRLPQKKETADTPSTEWSTASQFETPAKGREAGPGGGP